ncbi:MAG: response regulator [Myxococcales bacterium]|nr:response regulator [Myxococcales bacterium]
MAGTVLVVHEGTTVADDLRGLLETLGYRVTEELVHRAWTDERAGQVTPVLVVLDGRRRPRMEEDRTPPVEQAASSAAAWTDAIAERWMRQGVPALLVRRASAEPRSALVLTRGGRRIASLAEPLDPASLASAVAAARALAQQSSADRSSGDDQGEPRAIAASTAADPGGGAAVGLRGGQPGAAADSLRRARVLVVDDEAVIAQSIARMLRAQHEVVVEMDPTRALSRLASGEAYDVVFCDVSMPSMSGIDLYRELSATRPEQAKRVVFMTGGSSSPRSQAFLESVGNVSVGKPFSIHAIRAIVDGYVKPATV